MPNFRAATQVPQLTDEGRDFMRRLQQGFAQQADDAAEGASRGILSRGIGFLARRALGPFAAILAADRMGGATFDDIQLADLPEAMSTLPGGGMSVPLSDSGAMTPAQDPMLDRRPPSSMGMPGMLEYPAIPEAPPPPPRPSVQSGVRLFDSAEVERDPDPDVNILSIDVLPPRVAPEAPEAPAVPAAMDAPVLATTPAAPVERELAPSVSPFPTPRPEMQGPAMPMYEVQSGDYLGRIAQDVGIPLADLIALNPQIEDPDLIFPGQMLNLV